ncbi:hypothetical protein ASPZODRAFT_134312 [Penicilliopsis zonata CBS 506.65]|uniref:Inositolphosphotransferase Aur1/Ipt1 domain-containing protein n=1 Tax=Penicilliopsis zonata CBS 506.65 TaxID=1073090 RepID=A0A1L9SCQ3_9EURO|nr:hypothetical protein ASPZODRAFT_134312 [Penicilliopsis zonata CBS 506.65]OJJ44898.1 hypothetical protein ASPZODRAFT_134312 [Penicilliopsis zonata CBS 506.65]
MGLRNAVEPVAIAAIFTAGTIINRRKTPKSANRHGVRSPLLEEDPEDQAVQHACSDGEDDDGIMIKKPTLQTRVLAWFPFLLEIWYWLLIYWIYQGLRALSATLIRDHALIFSRAEHHGIQILALERIAHIAIEHDVQRFVLDRAPWLIPYLACVYYSHIVLGVVFFVYCYTFLPTARYQQIRRTLALENVIAFIILTSWRCTPPRLLPEKYGFVDVLNGNGNNPGGSWTHNRFQLTIAAMPSLHFGNAVLIAFCLVSFSPHRPLRFLAPLWPLLMGFTIIATANHYILDAVAGVCTITAAYRSNRVMLALLPVERTFFKLLRLEKPGEVPSKE